MTPAETAAALHAEGVRSLNELPVYRALAICADMMTHAQAIDAGQEAGKRMMERGHRATIQELATTRRNDALHALAVQFALYVTLDVWNAIDAELRALDQKESAA